jgi:hypothetical protein
MSDDTSSSDTMKAPRVPTAGGLGLVETAFQTSARSRETDVFDPDNFRQIGNRWWLDRALPGDVKRYFIAAILVCTGVWLLALILRLAEFGFADPLNEFWAFVRDRQWQLQPLLLLVHFICLRLFKGIYSRNFDRAFVHLDVKPAELERFRVWLTGARVNLLAFGAAAPFIIYECVLFATGERFYETVYGADSSYLARIDATSRTAEAWLLLALWNFEWLMYGYYCYLMLAGAVIVRQVLKRYDFVDSVDLVLTERQYRPLFNITAQAGSLVFFYGLIYAGYMLYSKAQASDVAGLIVLAVLLGLAFGLTWSCVRGELRDNVQGALEQLERSYRKARAKLATMQDVPGIEDDLQRIQVQLKMQLALQQLDYLQNKYDSLGRRELLGIFFRMLAPVGSVLARIIRWGSLMAALGLGGAALGDLARGRTSPPPESEQSAPAPEQPSRAPKQ